LIVSGLSHLSACLHFRSFSFVSSDYGQIKTGVAIEERTAFAKSAYNLGLSVSAMLEKNTGPAPESVPRRILIFRGRLSALQGWRELRNSLTEPYFSTFLCRLCWKLVREVL
jgi:hypothetical protein